MDSIWAFNQVDTAKSGKIMLEDVKTMLKEMDPTLTANDLKEIFKALDVSLAGHITFDVFEKIFKQQSAPM